MKAWRHGPRVAVIGCGVFGALVSLELSRRGACVSIFERAHDVLQGASLNNQNRLHLGFHYPRDVRTAEQCIEGFFRFAKKFKDCVSGNFPNAYFIASEGSLTTSENYIDFCERLGLEYKRVDPKEFCPPINNVDLGILTGEVVYDSRLLSKEMEKLLAAGDIHLVLGKEVTGISRNEYSYAVWADSERLGDFDFVVNCTYANYNRFNDALGIASQAFQYEYTMVPVLRWGQERVGVTVMDGPFMTVLPFGRTEDFLLYHVEYSVVETVVSEQLPGHWLDKSTAPSSSIDKEALYERMLTSSEFFLPSLKGAELIGFLEGPRMVLPNREHTDERISTVSCVDGRGFFSVFSGKIDHSIWVADDVADRILGRAEEETARGAQAP